MEEGQGWDLIFPTGIFGNVAPVTSRADNKQRASENIDSISSCGPIFHFAGEIKPPIRIASFWPEISILRS